MAGAIANDPSAPSPLITAIRRGPTVEARNETMLKVVLKRLEAAHKKGPAEWTAEVAALRAECVYMCVAVAQGAKKPVARATAGR